MSSEHSAADELGNKRGPIDIAWDVIASSRTTAILVVAASLAALIAALVPQGPAALQAARNPGADTLHALAQWGLTDVFSSPWFYSLAVLLAGNLTAVVFQTFARARADDAVARPPARPAHEHRIDAQFPEIAVEVLHDAYAARLGPPRAQRADNERAVLVFDSGSNTDRAPAFVAVGLLTMIVGAGLHAVEAQDERRSSPHAFLEITDSRSNTTTAFDLRAGESRQFFQWKDTYVLQSYTRSKDGLGPAVLIERRAPGQPSGESFWVYQNAPRGFDKRHRGGDVSIEASELRRTPLPGQGLADSPVGALLMFGLGVLFIGAAAGRSARGRVWVEAAGRSIRISGVPEIAGDSDFESRFNRWARQAERALADG